MRYACVSGALTSVQCERDADEAVCVCEPGMRAQNSCVCVRYACAECACVRYVCVSVVLTSVEYEWDTDEAGDARHDHGSGRCRPPPCSDATNS